MESRNRHAKDLAHVMEFPLYLFNGAGGWEGQLYGVNIHAVRSGHWSFKLMYHACTIFKAIYIALWYVHIPLGLFRYVHVYQTDCS